MVTPHGQTRQITIKCGCRGRHVPGWEMCHCSSIVETRPWSAYPHTSSRAFIYCSPTALVCSNLHEPSSIPAPKGRFGPPHAASQFEGGVNYSMTATVARFKLHWLGRHLFGLAKLTKPSHCDPSSKDHVQNPQVKYNYMSDNLPSAFDVHYQPPVPVSRHLETSLGIDLALDRPYVRTHGLIARFKVSFTDRTPDGQSAVRWVSEKRGFGHSDPTPLLAAIHCTARSKCRYLVRPTWYHSASIVWRV